jgi:protein-S-isoprenylcysteine O-methyltransferase Ste14
LVFAAGYFINRRSDTILRNLRKPGETGYKIPQGGMFRWISAPNYFGELTIWTGWAIATWSLAGLSFAVFTAANLVPRALTNHKWYLDKFPDYPAKRRAIIPYIL